MNRTTTLLLLFTAAIAIIVGVSLAAGNYFYNLTLNPDTDKSRIFGAQHNQFNPERDGETQESRLAWLEGRDWTRVSQQSFDCLELSAIMIGNTSPSHNWVICCHGYMSNCTQMLGRGRMFYQMGYNVLLPDSRGCGESQGDFVGMGWPDRLDMEGWIAKIIERDPLAKIVLYGASMGGATVMMTAGQDLPPNVRAVVEDCGYSSVWAEFSYQLKRLFGLSDFPVMHAASLVTRIKAGFWLDQASALDQVAKTRLPILFIHGDRDTFVPTAMVYQLYEACASDKELLVVEGAGHGMAGAVDPEHYWGTIEAFLGRYVI